MIQFDLHVHTIFSLCGMHTVMELINHAHSLGMKGLAITDHGQALGGRLNSPFFERFQSPVADVKVLKGVECNMLDENGTIDIPQSFMPCMDIVLLGIHPNSTSGKTIENYTEMLIRAIETNTCIDMITHPNESAYPVDYERLAQAAKKHGVAIELNNSKVLYNRSSIESTTALVDACKKAGCLMAVNSDAHAIHELGLDDSVRPILQSVGFEEEMIINSTEQSTLSFIDSRTERKK